MASKSLDGLTVGNFDEVFVSDDVLIQGNLTVNGTITGGSGPSTDNYYIATDSANQYRANSGTVELQSTISATPTFNFKNNAGSTATSTLVAGQGNLTNIQSTGISNSGTINTGSITSGSVNTTAVTVTGASDFQGLTSVTNTTQSTSTSTGALTTAGGLGVDKNTHIGGQLHVTSTTASTSTTTGSGRFNGGIGVAGNAYLGGSLNATNSASISNAASNDISIQRFANDSGGDGVIFKNGSTRIGDGGPNAMTIRNDAGILRLYDSTGTGFELNSGTITSPSSISAFSLTTSSGVTGATVTSTGNTAVGGNLTITGSTTMNDPLVQNDPLDADDANPGSLFTWGGLKTVKKVYAGTGVVVPYGQPIQANTAFTKNKMMQVDFSLSGGLGGDATYLYTPGNSAQASTSYVLGVNADACKLPQTTAATSTTTGALQVAGGVGIGGNLHVGGTITGGSVSYSSTSSGTFDVTNGTGTTFTVDSTDDATSTTTGCATFAGGIGVAKNLHVGGTLTAGTVTYATTSTGTMDITNSPGTTLTVDSTEQSTSITTGAATVVGGVGIGKNCNIGEDVTIGSTSLNGTRTVTISNQNAAGNIRLAFDTAAATNAEIYMFSTTDPFNPNDLLLRNAAGNLLLYGPSGGFYVGSTLCYSQLPFVVQNTNEALTITNASTMVSGGLGVVKDTRMGQNLFVGETPVNGANYIAVQNTSTAANAISMIYFDTSAAFNTALFMTGSGYVGVEGAPNRFTIRNDAGDVRIQSSGGGGSTLLLTPSVIESSKFEVTDATESTSVSTGALVVDGGVGILKNTHIGGQLHATATTESTSTTTGAIRVNGGVGVAKNVTVGGSILSTGEQAVVNSGKAEMRVFNNGGTTEWTFGQRSQSDHDFTLSSLVSGVYTDKMRVNTAGQLKLGNGDFFGYSEGTWTPTIDYTSAPPTSITYTQQYGRYVVVGKTVTLTYSLKFSYGLGATGSYFLIRGIPANLALTTQEEVTQVCFRGNFAGITNPFYTTLWKNGYNLPGVAVFDGRTMTIGTYSSGGYITGAYQAFGAGGQEMWGTLTYTL